MTQHQAIYNAIRRLKKWANTNQIIASADKKDGITLDYEAVSRRVSDLNSGRYGCDFKMIEKKRMESGTILYRLEK